MGFFRIKDKRGFSLAELMIVVAILAILMGMAFLMFNPKDISHVEYNRSADAIATAAQNRLTEIRNTGDMTALRKLGMQAKRTGDTVVPVDKTEDESAPGGYRYVFNFKVEGGVASRVSGLGYILPFGAIESQLSEGYIVIGFQSDTGIVGEVYYSPKPFGDGTVSTLLSTYQNDEEKRRAEDIGYYQGTSVDDSEIAFANLPTPQITVINYEELTLSIHLPEVKQLKEKNLGILISLSDKNGKAFASGISLADAAIYSTFKIGAGEAVPEPSAEGGIEESAAVVEQTVSSGKTYTLVLDTVKDVSSADMLVALDGTTQEGAEEPSTAFGPKAKFEDWAKRSAAYKKKETDKDGEEGDYFYRLGDNAVITVTVYCLSGDGKGDSPIDPTYMPRSASVTFNGWYNDYNDSTVDIACGRHLQNLGKLAEMRENLTSYLPTITVDGHTYHFGRDELPRLKEDSVYIYGDYNYGMASTFTDGSDHGNPTVGSSDVMEKYVYRDHVKSIKYAYQVNAIDFDCEEWKNGEDRIPFTPINLPKSFYYYGNYLTISHLYVNSPFYAGLFGYAYHQRLYDILLVNPSVTSQMPAHIAELYEMGAGALIGTSRDSDHINNCQVYMTQDDDGSYHPEKYRVTGECYVGGLIGFCEDEHIENCSASVYTGYRKGAKASDGTTPIASRYVGGLVGAITGDSNLDSCYAAGNLTGEYVGGLVGLIREDSDPSGDDYRIETCYTAGHIEYATKTAAGILGCISELSGNAKSAVSIYNNYCVVIYGEKGTVEVNGVEEERYQWNGGAPIYGTFEGDGFEWLHTDDLGGYSDVYLTSKYAGDRFFASAIFADDNKNYYIAQKYIPYQNSSYFNAMRDEVQDLLADIQNDGTNESALKADVEKAQDKIFWLKKLQTLEELKKAMENILYQMDSETGKDTKGNPYTNGGYSSHGTDIYIDTNDAEIVSKDNVSSSSTHKVKLTAQQALHAIYNGTYTDSDGTEKTITITDQNYDKSSSKSNGYKVLPGAIDDFTFMGFYNALKGAYEALADDDPSNDKDANDTLTYMFGDTTRETYKATDDEGKPIDIPYYQAGKFYHCFYSNLLYRLFDKCKDYYQSYFDPILGEDGKQLEDSKGHKLYNSDLNGELIYRYFRDDLCEEKILDILCDLGMRKEARDFFVLRAKSEAMEDILKDLKANLETFKAWRESVKDEDGNIVERHMKDDADEATSLTNTAISAVEDLKKLFDDAMESLKTKGSYSYTTDTLNEKIKTAKDALQKIYDFFDGENAYGKDLDRKDVVDYIGKDDKGKWQEGDMRNFRNPVSGYLRDVGLCAGTANSGVEEALCELATNLREGKGAKASVDIFQKEINTYLGNGWDGLDSGHNIKNSEQLRNAARGYVDGKESSKQEEKLGFMYDYGNDRVVDKKDTNPYTRDDKVANSSFVDRDNKIYNNVFPYTENGDYTKYYPFPFVYGRTVENSSTKYQATYVLFHYGDWLTQDLWAPSDPTTALLDKTQAQLDALFNQVKAAADAAGSSGTTGQIGTAITNVENAINSCKTAVNEASNLTDKTQRDAKLTEIKTTISGWLESDGVMTKLVDACKKHGQKVFSQEFLNSLENYKAQLSAIVSDIDAILTKKT